MCMELLITFITNAVIPFASVYYGYRLASKHTEYIEKKKRESHVRYLCMKTNITESEWIELLAITGAYYNFNDEDVKNKNVSAGQTVIWEHVKDRV